MHRQSCIVLLSLAALLSLGCEMRRNQEVIKEVTSKTQPMQISVPRFDGKRAFEFLVAQTNFGPRVPNTEAHRNCLNFITRELGQLADTVYHQPFRHTGYDGKLLYLTNIVASWNREAQRRILLCAHWDSRPWADQDPDPVNRSKAVPGANDGASGVAVLLEIARHLKTQSPSVGVEIVLFDGEDYGRAGDLDHFVLGSKYFVQQMRKPFAYEFGILLDMVGDSQLEILKERNSLRYAPDIIDLVWSAARDVGSTSFVDVIGDEVYDDHVPLNEAGVKTIDIIDFAYPDQSHRYWHTVEDTPDKCSPESLEEVGNVVLYVIYQILR